jgi:hypothetical protein
MKIHYITYISQGGNIDKGADLSRLKRPLEDIFSRYLDRVTIYESKDVPYEYRREHDSENYECEANPEYHNLGFAAFKPYLILKTLEETDCDVVYWRDANFIKYHKYLNHLPDIKETIEWVLKETKTDIFAPFEIWDIFDTSRKTGMSCPSIMFDRILGGILDSYVEYNEINNGLIILKNTEYAKKLVKVWLENMDNDDFFSNRKESRHSNFIKHSSDQSVFNVIIMKEIIEGRLPQGFPFFGFVDRDFHSSTLRRIEDLPHLKSYE